MEAFETSPFSISFEMTGDAFFFFVNSSARV
jgi:hypothetical protein